MERAKIKPMPYGFATENIDYSDYAGGRVLYSAPGAAAFPVRLVSEIFQRARQHFEPRRLTVYDPTCGGAYHLAALGFLHGDTIEAILASDANEGVLPLAGRNLGLLLSEGLARRAEELSALYRQYGKESHAAALRSAAALSESLKRFAPIRTRLFQANALDPHALTEHLSGETIDLVISDVPYGQLTGWVLPAESTAPAPLWQMLDALLPVLSQGSLVCIAADKHQKAAHEGYQRVERFQIGKRQVVLLRPSA